MLDNLPEIDDSAVGVAALRVMENLRESPLVTDPFAARILAVGVPSGHLSTTLADADFQTREVVTEVAVCGQAFDEFIDGGFADGIAQLVIIGAGLDSRAWRLPVLRAGSIFEIDRPAVMEFKDRVMTSIGESPRAGHHLIGAQLDADWPRALRAAGFDSRRPCVWLAEGVIAQLPADTERTLLERVDALSASGSRIALNHLGTDPGSALRSMQHMREEFGIENSEWSRETQVDVRVWLEQHGWQVEETSVIDRAHEVGRDLSADIEMVARSRIVLAGRDR